MPAVTGAAAETVGVPVGEEEAGVVAVAVVGVGDMVVEAVSQLMYCISQKLSSISVILNWTILIMFG